MVQPMVGKMILPLLGGSPAVWNACMVFFQALLLLGYLYADRLTRQENTRKQWIIHMCVMALPVAVFALAVLLGTRHTPIAAVESLAPTDGSSAILSVLAILTVAIGIPFFVVSTSATLLQKWFTYTGHPSARDPYFLYAASNFGSLISLLGYPIFIEPNMTQGAQTWFWAAGFVALIGLIAFCGRAAVNPLGVPPGAALATAGANGKQGGKQSGNQNANAQKTNANATTVPVIAPAGEPPPSWARMAKWTALAFVPSSLMLGVTFHMTTDIASIPLLWVGPLALYLLTFIIAFGRVPPWFRILIGNLAPVMILLLVFLLISGVDPGIGIKLLLHLLTFFAAALMCHYELARDRPSPQYLTTYFLIMSLGGVLGGIFNSLLAPLVFQHAYEYPLAAHHRVLHGTATDSRGRFGRTGPRTAWAASDRNNSGQPGCASLASRLEILERQPAYGAGSGHRRSGHRGSGVLAVAEVAKPVRMVREDGECSRGGTPGEDRPQHDSDCADIRNPGDGVLLLRGPPAPVRAVRGGDPRPGHH